MTTVYTIVIIMSIFSLSVFPTNSSNTPEHMLELMFYPEMKQMFQYRSSHYHIYHDNLIHLLIQIALTILHQFLLILLIKTKTEKRPI